MKLAVSKRTAGKKGETSRLRREGSVPGILYGSDGAGSPIALKKEEIQAVLRNVEPGCLATTVFELEIAGKPQKAIVKDIQYHVASYDVLHVDFACLSENQPVTVQVPILLSGVADCAGVKLGGFIRQVIRSLKVSCLPKDIPSKFSLNVADLGLAESRTLAQIEIPANVRPLAKMGEVAVIIGKKAGAG